MIRKNILQKVVIENAVGKLFEAEFNEAMKALAECNPQVTYPQNVQGHCCYITYTEEVIQPEDARDNLELKGIMPVCGECPYYQKPGDGRLKSGTCELAIEPAPYYSKRACIHLCELIDERVIEWKGLEK